MDAYRVVDSVRVALLEQASGNEFLVLVIPGITQRKESLRGFASEVVSMIRGGADLSIADLYAQGGSSGSWDLAAMIRGFSELIGQYRERYERIAVIGISVGGIIASYASTTTRIERLVLINTPGGPQDPLPKWLLNHPEVPRPLIAFALKTYDRLERAFNETYRNTTGTEERDDSDALSFDGVRIDDPHGFIERLAHAPRIEDVAEHVRSPTLFVYGGNQPFFGIRGDELSESIRVAIERWSAPNETIIVPGADHGLNDRTWADRRFNENERFTWVRTPIAHWLSSRST